VDTTLSLQERIDAINLQGGVAILAHPNLRCRGYRIRNLIAAENYLGIEIYNSFLQKCCRVATDKWDAALTSGKRIWSFGVDDSHSESQRGKGFFCLFA